MSHEIDAVNWDDTPFVILNLADVKNLREFESDTLDTILAKAGRSRHQRGGVDTGNALVIPISDPLYATFRATLEARSNPEKAAEPKHWYLVSWAGDRERGCTEVPCSLPLAAGDMLGLIAYLTKQNPTAGVISIQGVFPLAPKRPVVEAPAETEKPENPSGADPRRFDVHVNGKVARAGVTQQEAWDFIEKQSPYDRWHVTHSNTDKFAWGP